MVAVGELVLVLGLLVSAHCEVRARDPEVEEEEEGGRGGRGGFVTETLLPAGTGISPVRTGNWCAFVRKSVQLVAEECKTWRHVQNQSPCPRESPGCQRATYRLRPGCQKQKEVTTLVWRCCPGHGGPNCDQEGDPAGLQRRADPDREQNDHQTTFTDPYDPQGSAHPGNAPTHRHHPIYHQNQNQNRPPPLSRSQEGVVLPYPDVPAALPVPDMMALVLSQLHPILEGFNRSLERLHHHVGALSQDVAEMKVSRRGVEPQEEEDAEEKLESKLDGMFQEIGNVRRQIQEWRSDTESRLNSQRDEMQLNLSSFRLEVDQELKQQQKVLQALNATQAGMKLDRDRTPEDHQLSSQRPADNTALWDAITRLDNMVVNNTIKVEELTEDLDITSADGQQMALQLKNLEKLINQTARKSQILFMETGLEVEKSKVTVEQLVEQLVVNLTRYEKDLRENTKDVDNLYKDFHNLNPTKDCRCGDLNAAVTRLERGVANVTQLANQNRLELEENSEVGGAPWGGVSDWEPAVEVLQAALEQVKQSVALEQNRTRTLDLGLAQLSGSVSALQDEDVQLDQQVKTLSTSFQSLLQDAIRHSDVLQLLLGEEVLEFLEWPLQDQEAHSVPALQEQLRRLQEQLRSREEAELQEPGAGSREEIPAADQPLWPPAGRRENSGAPLRENQRLPQAERGAADSLRDLERKVEQQEQRLVRAEERSCSCSSSAAPPAGREAALQVEVLWLRRGLEEHLKVFKNVFSNAEVLEASGDTLQLDRLLELTKRRDRKRGGGGGGRKGGGGGGRGGGGGERGGGGRERGGQRSRRESPGELIPSSQSGVSVLFVGGSDRTVRFGPGQDSRLFTAPLDGLYLFMFTLDLRPGSAHILLRRGQEGGGAPVTLLQRQVKGAGPVSGSGLLMLQQGEQVRLQVRAEWAESESNLLAVLLLQPTT
ncbi:multimerin-2-like isoform X2 [Xiphophorus hellerii]|uniref:multimerin-2-like isoform X2 n=1 Tax=Xiphophorus hellerii TaxID=8084 RepID=UPI0013B41A4F|nr:multimerin-2-like isoform X2 [Xiphophorus hellerii]